ncbi:hypothetical protein OH76DRAFT_252652 [Lentinus brumalis]|uniref:Uncharacterized protein n=1 Tax=Lentinus brumalis TaxID=2498619 RepID=A0A371CLC0_9APHY|nr:hypothetical protein OH76DRAFT_252652 [Polyporus brumalis]
MSQDSDRYSAFPQRWDPWEDRTAARTNGETACMGTERLATRIVPLPRPAVQLFGTRRGSGPHHVDLSDPGYPQRRSCKHPGSQPQCEVSSAVRSVRHRFAGRQLRRSIPEPVAKLEHRVPS